MKAFYDIHTAQEKKTVIIFKRQNMEYIPERYDPHLPSLSKHSKAKLN